MQRPSLSRGDKGDYVIELQETLNYLLRNEDRLNSPKQLEVNGKFDEDTYWAVWDFQIAANLYRDGKVGQNTWAALTNDELYNCYDIPQPAVPAPDETSCWAGATAMLLGRGVSIANDPKIPNVDYEKSKDGKIGGLGNKNENMQLFANHYGIQMVKGEISCSELCQIVKYYGRVMLNIKGINAKMKRANPDDSHLVVLVGLRGNGTPGSTTLTIYNPSDLGSRVVKSYQSLRSAYSHLTYQSFYVLNNFSSPHEYYSEQYSSY